MIHVYDYLSLFAWRVACFLSSPFLRLERWAADRYFEAQRRGSGGGGGGA